MARWLTIEAMFLSGRYHGRRRDGAEAEWPPAPHRLFQALVAAAHLGTRAQEWSDAKADAFRWLERRDPPEIAAAEGQKGSAFTLSVPNNDMDVSDWVKAGGKAPSALRTMKPFRPMLLNGDSTVRFLWPISDEEWPQARAHAELLAGEARYLHSLGLGLDLVAGNGLILDDKGKSALPGDVWLADPNGKSARVQREGSFDELIRRHAAFLNRVASGRGADRFIDPPAPPLHVQWVSYRRRTDARIRMVHAFDLVKPNGAVASFDPQRAIHVAAWLRHAAHQAAKKLKLESAFVDRFVCGHGENEADKNDRFSYLPLPTLPAKGQDGRIRRVLLAEPFGASDSRASAIAYSLANGALIDEAGEIKADLRAIDDRREGDFVFSRYLKKSRKWGSVTPLVIPGRDDYRTRKAHALVLKALGQAGFTTPVTEIHLQREPVFPGARLAAAYRVPTYLKEFPRSHAVINFAEEVYGPVALGAGRHSGIGIFAALEDAS